MKNGLRKWADWLHDHHAPLISLLLGHLICMTLLILWQAGGLQVLELMVYDQGLRWQTLASPDDRMVLIGETEADIQRWGYPLPDGVMAEMLERLAQARPRVIGIDKYRDLPVPPGSERLDQVLRSHPEMIWIMKFGNAVTQTPPIHPPPRTRSVSTMSPLTRTVEFDAACCFSTMASTRPMLSLWWWPCAIFSRNGLFPKPTPNILTTFGWERPRFRHSRPMREAMSASTPAVINT